VTLLVEYVFGVCMTKECELLQWHPHSNWRWCTGVSQDSFQ